MSGPDVRWEGVSHLQIVAWVGGRGAQVTETLEARLKSATDTLTQTGDKVNATLQRVNAGEWTGSAATVAAQSMQVMRDFDDAMGNHGKMGDLAAFGQSDTANWAKSSVPPMGSVEPPAPNGSMIDLLNATQDYNEQLKAARNAEEQARQVMRDYQSMTTDRVTAMPPLSPAPQVVVAGEPDTITVPPGGPGPGTGSRNDFYAPPRGDDPIDGAASPRPGGSPSGAPPNSGPPTGSQVPAVTDPSSVTDTRAPVTSPVGPGIGGDTSRPTTPGPSGYPGLVAGGGDGGPLRGGGGGRTGGPLRGGGQPGGLRAGEPNSRSPLAGGARTTRGVSAARGGAPGMAPVGAGRGQSDEDKEHQVKYAVAGDEIFEPDHDDGLLYDPYRPGSFVAPATIGNDEDE